MAELGRLPEPRNAKPAAASTVIWNPVFDWDRESWRDLAACRFVGVGTFFPVGNTGAAIDKIEAAKAVCQSCPVRDACLEFALETKQESGVWGGTDEDERRRLRRAWRAGRPRLPRSASV